MGTKIKAIIFWEGFPVCGLLIKKVVDELKENVIIVATKPSVPFIELEKMLGHEIIWLDNPSDIWERKEEFGVRNLIIHTGWIHKGWLRYDNFAKKNYNAKVIVAVDNRFRGDLRQIVGAVWFRLFLKKYFDAVLVPGKTGIKLMKFLGMNPSHIYTGLYGAYEEIFKTTTPIEKRNNEFLFIGQLITRKSVDILVKSFTEYRKRGGTWSLRIIGDGPLRTLCNGDEVILEAFAQPHDIAKKMNSAKVLILPSKDDNWGTVVCEAAACGMHLITTTKVGAHEDIIKNNINGIVLKNLNVNTIIETFFYFETLPQNKLIEGSLFSREIASHYTSENYHISFLKIIKNLFKKEL